MRHHQGFFNAYISAKNKMISKKYFFVFCSLTFLSSCESERTACDCHKTANEIIKKKNNGEIPAHLTEVEITEKYLKGCEWMKEVDRSVLIEELSDCPKYQDSYK